MCAASYFVFLGTLCAMVLARPTEIDDIFFGYLKNVNLHYPEKQSDIVKRRIYEENQDSGNKKVSLQSLIGNLEQNFIKSASGVSDILRPPTGLAETNPTPIENHPIQKRKTENTRQVDHIPHKDKKVSFEETTTAESIETSTYNISTKEIGATLIQIEHISVQPQYGDLPAVPAFDVHHARLELSTLKDGSSDPTQITHTTAKIQVSSEEKNTDKSNENLKEIKVKDTKDKINDQIEVTHESNYRVTEQPEVVAPTTTTGKKSLEEIKESEAELKEKVAEIEAEPVILSARV